MIWTYLSNWLKISVGFQVVDTLTLGFTVGASLVYWTFTSSTTHTNAVDAKTLLGLVAQTTCLVGTTWTWCTMHLGQLTILPDANTQQVAHDIALLLAIQFLYVTIGSHLVCVLIDLATKSSKYWSEVTSSVYQIATSRISFGGRKGRQ